MSRTIRGLAAICVAAALGGAAASASAAPVARRRRRPPLPRPRIHRRGPRALPTGDGPGDEEVCSGFGDDIEVQQGVLADDIGHGDLIGALGRLEATGNLVDMAGDAGCAVIYSPPRPTGRGAPAPRSPRPSP